MEKFDVFSCSGRFTAKKEIVEPDRSTAERVGFNDVGAGVEIIAVDLFDDFRPRQEKNFQATFKVFAVPIFESLAAILSLSELALLDHRAHGAVQDDDALAHERFERMEAVVGHDG